MSQNDFYHENYQGRRCQLNIHNFPTYDNDNEILVCKRCKYIQTPHNIPKEIIEDNNDN